jgi:hypothetical protein
MTTAAVKAAMALAAVKTEPVDVKAEAVEAKPIILEEDHQTIQI